MTRASKLRASTPFHLSPSHRDRLFLLGQFSFQRRGADGESGGTGAGRLLAFLGVRGPTPRAVAAGALWPGSDECRASGSLRTSIWRLRQVGIDVLSTGVAGLAIPDAVDVDVRTFLDFLDRLGRCRSAAEADLDPARVPSGDLLPGWSDTWVLVERERLHHLRLHALELVARELLRRRRAAEAVVAARTAVTIDPLRESAVRLLIDAHLQHHDVVEAVRTLDSYRQDVRRELRIDVPIDLASTIDRALQRWRVDRRSQPTPVKQGLAP